MSEGVYQRPSGVGVGELVERKSRFRAEVFCATSENQALAQVERVRQQHPDVRHVCWALRIGHPARERSSDAGEPAGTAGAPILRVLAGADLSDVVAVVVRWFGGIKLGRGGLARAYSQAVKQAIQGLNTIAWAPSRRLRLDLPYRAEGGVQRLLRAPGVRVVDRHFEERVLFDIEVHETRVRELTQALLGLGCRVVEPGAEGGLAEAESVERSRLG